MNNIYLIGFMGVGKTAVGKVLADKLGWTFLDIDEVIVDYKKCSIEEIFIKYGEDTFRKIESKVLKKLSKKTEQVVSTGGGIVVNKYNIEYMKESGFVVTLIARPEVIYNRIYNDEARPLLKNFSGDAKLDEIKRLLYIRAGLYTKGDYIIDTSDLTVSDVAEEIKEAFFERKHKS
ncbi:MAG: shikimate kinase [Deferribacterota bacterium]|nr:shikimate kinase [Deferribacterota bacterium]